jgi:uncharacterized surface protein with fasciclin (FAS1) repeats
LVLSKEKPIPYQPPLPPNEAPSGVDAAAGVTPVGLRPPFVTPAAAHPHPDCRGIPILIVARQIPAPRELVFKDLLWFVIQRRCDAVYTLVTSTRLRALRSNPMHFLKFAAASLVAFAFMMPVANAADIVETAVSAGNFKTLVAAVTAAGLVDTLKGKGPFTVFAPTDEAFAKLPAGTVDSLLKPENKAKLVGILTYHVVPAKVMSSEIAGKKAMVKTVQGSEISVDAMNGVMINNAKVIKADIEASNGVIHVIDTVLLPK